MEKNKLNIKYLPAKTWSYTNKIESIEKIKIGVIDGALNPELFNDYTEYYNFTENTNENFNVAHSAVISSIIKDIYPSSQLYISQVYCGENDTQKESSESILKALSWLVQNEVSIINMSLGFYNNCKGDCLWEQRFKILQEKYGVIIVVAGGNTHPEHPNHSISCPGCSCNTITVGSLDMKLYIDKEMNLKPIPERNKPDLYVNGYVNVELLDGSLKVYSGTSFSAPIIVGLIAKHYGQLIKNPDISQVVQILNGIENYLKINDVNYEKQKLKEVRTGLEEKGNNLKVLINNQKIIGFLKKTIQINNEIEVQRS